MKKTFLAAAVSLVLAPLSAHAATPADPLCDTVGSWAWIKDIEGPWHENHMAGFVRMGPTVIPFPAAPNSETITLKTEDLPPKLTFTGPDGIDLVLTAYDGPAWTWNHGGANEPQISAEDLAIVAGCDNDHLPRFEGSVSYQMDGTPMTLTYKMILISQRQLFGIMDISAPHMTGKRWVQFNR